MESLSSRRWTTALICWLADTAWDMWHHQNKVLHKSSHNKENLLEANINQELQELYDLGPQSVPQDALHIRKQMAEQLRQLPSMYKHQWVETMKLAQARHKWALEGPYHLECQGMTISQPHLIQHTNTPQSCNRCKPGSSLVTINPHGIDVKNNYNHWAIYVFVFTWHIK